MNPHDRSTPPPSASVFGPDMAPLPLAPAVGRPGIDPVCIDRHPREPSVGRHPFPIRDLSRPTKPKLIGKLAKELAWLDELYRCDLPLRGFTLFAADDVWTFRGSVWHRGDVLEGTLSPKVLKKPDARAAWHQQLQDDAADQRFVGSSAIIHAAGYRNYFHWTTEILPRLYALREGLRRGTLQFDRIVLFYSEPIAFVAESIAALLPDLAPMIVIVPARTTWLERCYFFVDGAGEDGTHTDHQDHTSRLKSCTAFLTEAIDERLASRPRTSAGRVLLASRADASKRRLINEDLILQAFADLGIERVEFSAMTVGQQIDLMADARMLIGAHGAALTNAIYCRPGTMLLEINSPHYIKRCRSYADIAMYRGLRYGLMIADNVAAAADAETDDPDVVIDANGASALRVLAEELAATALR